MGTIDENSPTVERTLNKKGFMFVKPNIAAKYWLASLANSNAPLLDLGAAFGVHTVHAIKAGRDVFAVDSDSQHLEILQERVTALLPTDGKPHGKLIGSKEAILPKAALFGNASAAGILFSEVAHFMSPSELQGFMWDAIRWLQPGGRLVLTSASVHMVGECIKAGMARRSGGTEEEMYAMLASDIPDREVVDAAPGYLEMTPESKYAEIGPPLFYLTSVRELAALGRAAGFEVEHAEYISPRKYPIFDLDSVSKNGGEATLLVARKPE
jgi:SAM-dependent methyltransferase